VQSALSLYLGRERGEPDLEGTSYVNGTGNGLDNVADGQQRLRNVLTAAWVIDTIVLGHYATWRGHPWWRTLARDDTVQVGYSYTPDRDTGRT